MINFKKGNGTMMIGVSFMLLALIIYAYFANLFLYKQQQYDAQLAADAMADGIAVKMVNGGNSEDDAWDAGLDLMSLINKHTNIKIREFKINSKQLKDKKTAYVTVQTYGAKTLTKDTRQTVFHKAVAATVFSSNGLAGVDEVLQWGADSAKYATYDNENRTGIGSHGYITNTDCSGFCWLLYKRMGCTAPLWYTGDMGRYFTTIPASQAMRGDVLFITAEERGTKMGHAKMYLGNGKTLEMSGHNAGIHYGTVNLNNLEGYHFGRIKKQYMTRR